LVKTRENPLDDAASTDELPSALCGPFLPSVTRFDWTDERVAIMARLAAAGQSATQIAAVIGAPTRDTVCGKLRRLKIKVAGGTGVRQYAKHAKPRSAPTVPPKLSRAGECIRASSALWSQMPRRVVPIAPVVFAPPPVGGVRLVDIGNDQCRWPMGDPRDAEGFRFCGAHAERSFCVEHHRMVYVPTARQRARASLSAIR
jgi:hypothetical protein